MDNYELVVDENGKMVRGYPGGLKDVIMQLSELKQDVSEIKSKLDQVLEKIPPAMFE